jgi:hypothetical protein
MPEQALTERARLEAGGLVRVGADVGADLSSDTVDARGYSSPALPGRIVVRLVPDAIARGIDTEMELLSFAMTSHADDIAVQRRRALGFPGTALVIDPERARYALDVMREFKTHAKRISSKPGHAKDGFDAVGERLSRQVPHFLPSYYEEVARAFAVAGNLTYAGTFFDKARTAEREFGLEVDEERRAEAFLEFALLGALTVKSIQSYGKEVQRLAGAEKAYERMYQLATRRTLGGVAPWATLPKDLRSLAKAAKRDLRAEDARFLREVSTAASIKRAPGSFWIEYRDAWVELAQAEPAVRGRLLDLFPNGGKTRYAWREDTSGFTEQWMELLHACGAFEALWADVEAPARPGAGRAGWFATLQGWCSAGDAIVLQLVRKAAPKLIADAVPVQLATGDYYRPFDLDLVDLLAELGVPWAIAQGWRRVELEKWATWKPGPARMGFPVEHRPRDPVYAAKQAAVVELLRPAIDGVFGNPQFESVAAGMEGMRELRRSWLTERLAELSGPGLAATEYALGRLEASTSADHFAEFPDASAALQEAAQGARAIGASLGATLRAGLPDELHWPAWEEAREYLNLGPNTAEGVFVQWPHLLWFTPTRLCVVDQDRVVLKLDLKHGDGKVVPWRVWYVGGKVLVAFHYWAKGGNVNVAYWSHAPNDTFELPFSWRSSANAWPVEHADAIVVGTNRLTVGDRSAPDIAPQFHDATTSWVVVDGKLRVQDRSTGAPGPEGGPGFLRGSANGYYHAVSAPSSPLAGVVDGQYGLRRVLQQRATDDDGDELEDDEAPNTLVTLAGDRFPGTMLDGTTAVGISHLVRFPARTALRGVGTDSRWRSGGRTSRALFSAPDQQKVSFAQDLATHRLPPLETWHHLSPRHEGSSRALAALGDDAATALVAADPAGLAVAGVTDAAVHAAVGAQVAEARALADRVTKLAGARLTGGVVRPKPVPRLGDEALAPALSNLRHYWTYGDSSVSAAIETLGRFLRDGESGEHVLFSRLEPTQWIGRIRGLAVSAARPGVADEHRVLLAKAVRLFQEAGLAGPRVRTGVLGFSKLDLPWVTVVDGDDGAKKPSSAWRHHDGAHRLFVTGVTEQGDDESAGPWSGTFVQHVTEGELETPKGATLSEVSSSDPADEAWLPPFLDALATRGPWALHRAEVDRFSEAVGITPTDAAVVLAGFPLELDKALREDLGLKHTDVKAACQRLRSVSFADKLSLLAARAGEDPASVWDEHAVERVIGRWSTLYGRRIAVDEVLLAAADKELGRGSAAKVSQLANHRSWKVLHEDVAFTLDASGDPETDDEVGFTSSVALDVARTVCWLAGRLPVGHPVRDELPAVIDAARARLANPKSWFAGGRWYHYEEKQQKVAKSWFDALPGRAEETAKDDEGQVTTWRKVVGAVAVTRSTYWTRTAFQFATLDPAGRDLLVSLAKMAEQDVDALWPVETLKSAGMTGIVDRIRSSPLGAGSWEQNPLASAPDVVKAVAKKRKLSERAAAAWLQLLVLVEPTKKAVCEWNGWTPKVYDDAVAELVAAELVVVGKRARAGREHFLPGGWEDPKHGPPYELWKEPLYGKAPKATRFPLGSMVPLEPLHTLFAAAWARCEHGDAPAFEEVRR